MAFVDKALLKIAWFNDNRLISARYRASNGLFLWNIKKGGFDRDGFCLPIT